MSNDVDQQGQILSDVAWMEWDPHRGITEKVAADEIWTLCGKF